MGAKDGPGTVYAWSPPSLMPVLLPWVGLALLVLPRQNRSLQLLWVLLPLGFFMLGTEALLSVLRIVGSAGSEQIQVFTIVIMGVAFGQAAIMMLSPLFKGRGRFLTFLGILLFAALFGVGSVALRQDWNTPGDSELQMAMTMSAVLNLIVAVILALTGLCCRRHYSWWRFGTWALLWNIVGMAAVVITLCIADSSPGFWKAVLITFVFSAITFGMILPFLILSFANPLFRAHLMDLFSMQPAAAAAVATASAAPTVPPATSGPAENPEQPKA